MSEPVDALVPDLLEWIGPRPGPTRRSWPCGGPVTLLYASRDESHNNALALKHWLERR